MKIILDVPDNIACAYFSYIVRTYEGMEMRCTLLGSDDFVEGNEIQIPEEGKDGD